MADPTAGTYACENCGGLIFHEAPAFPLCDNCAAKEAEKKAARAQRKAEREGAEPTKEEAPAKEGAAEQQVNPADPSTFSESGKVNPNQQDKPANLVTGGTESVGRPENRPTVR